MAHELRNVMVSVFGINVGGAPDIWQATCNVSAQAFRDGEHLDKAKQMAEDDGFEPKFACDTEDMENFILPRLQVFYGAYFAKAQKK